jgi:hypothetical protein
LRFRRDRFESAENSDLPVQQSTDSPQRKELRRVDLSGAAEWREGHSLSLDRPLVGKRSLTGFGDHYPNDGNPPRAGAYRSRLDRGQPIEREPVQQRIREAMGQHVRHRAAMLRVDE